MIGPEALGRDLEMEARLHARLADAGWPEWVPRPLVYTAGGFVALVGREPAGGRPEDPLRWHVSLQGPERIPTWGEVVTAAHKLRPGVPFVLAIPPRSQWLNLHPHVLHVWETCDEPLLAEWRVNGRAGDLPTPGHPHELARG